MQHPLSLWAVERWTSVAPWKTNLKFLPFDDKVWKLTINHIVCPQNKNMTNLVFINDTMKISYMSVLMNNKHLYLYLYK